MKELGAKIRWKKRQADLLKNETKYICQDIVDEIIEKAGDDLFKTPVPSEIPTDSFAEDFDPDFFAEDILAIKIEGDLTLKSIDGINRESDAIEKHKN